MKIVLPSKELFTREKAYTCVSQIWKTLVSKLLIVNAKSWHRATISLFFSEVGLSQCTGGSHLSMDWYLMNAGLYCFSGVTIRFFRVTVLSRYRGKTLNLSPDIFSSPKYSASKNPNIKTPNVSLVIKEMITSIK